MSKKVEENKNIPSRKDNVKRVDGECKGYNPFSGGCFGACKNCSKVKFKK